MKHMIAAFCLALAAVAPATARNAPSSRQATARALATITHDPPRDAHHPARNQQLLIDSHGAKMNALFFLAAGAGPHPTMLLLHGLPGNERNLDLAQAVRRAGWNVLTFTYRGAWGSEGDFSISNSLEDAGAALEFLRSDGAERAYNIDPSGIVVAGHSMGGFAAAATVARDLIPDDGETRMSSTGEVAPGPGHRRLAGLILLDAWNIAADATQPRAALVAGMDDFGRALHGATPESVADEVIARGRNWSLPALAPRLAQVPVLTITATHGGAADNRATTEALRRAGAHVTALEIDSDHPFADHRIEMEMAVVRWLRARRAAR
jgi:pimeloyl-ACP methyl ester carboxylesterase